ncbi:MAG: hypothetical protein ACOCUS_03445, partial [Polyangiales bacterium]
MRKKWGWSIVATGVAVAACNPTVTPNPQAEDSFLKPGQGRSFAARVSIDSNNAIGPDGEEQLKRIEVSPEDPFFSEMVETLRERCFQEAEPRFDDVGPGDGNPNELALNTDLGQANPPCGGAGAQQQQVSLCMGYRFSTMAESIEPTQVLEDGTVRVGKPQEPVNGPQPVFTVPAPSTSDEATLTLVALRFFRAAALQGAMALDPQMCPNGEALAQQVPAGSDDELEGGLSDTDTVPLSFVIANATSESLLRLDDTSENAQRTIKGAAQGKTASDRDEARANTNAWRGQQNSRLEVASVFTGVAARLFEPEEDDGMDGPDAPNGELDVCDQAANQDVQERAESLLRETGTDVRASASELQDGVIEDRLRRALEQDDPGTFEDMDTMSDQQFFEEIGADTGDLRTAAQRLVREAEVLGRPIVEDPSRSTSDLTRVVGTSANSPPADPAFLMAKSAGSARFDDPVDPGATEHSPSSSYALRSVIGTRDFVTSCMQRALGRRDIEDDASRELLHSAVLTQRETLPMRMEVSMGQGVLVGDEEGVSHFRVRLYGVEQGLTEAEANERYRLWWGEEGLKCATTGRLEGLPCQPAELQVDADAAVRTDGGDSGLTDTYVEWTVSSMDSNLIDAPAGTLPAGEHVYLIDSSQGPTANADALSGFALEPGEDPGTFSRRMWLPVGDAVLDTMQQTLAPSPEQCENDENTCSGLPRDFKLKLEDELTEATEGRDDIESSFARFLRLAKESAAESDRLANKLIQEGLDLDLRSEAARDRLEQICGGVVNVPELAPDPPATCDTTADCEGEE